MQRYDQSSFRAETETEITSTTDQLSLQRDNLEKMSGNALKSEWAKGAISTNQIGQTHNYALTQAIINLLGFVCLWHALLF